MSEMPPEQKAQLEEQKKNCIFCRIMSGHIQGKKVYSDGIVQGILDINPIRDGHMIILPEEHLPIMPLLPPETFRHMFGLMPRFVNALKQSMLSTACNVFIANGGVAGQQAPHFLVHLIPREKGDWLDKFSLNRVCQLNHDALGQAYNMIKNNLPIMMNNHFKRSMPEWLHGEGRTAEHLIPLKQSQEVLYEDKKALVLIPKNPQCTGHMEIYSNAGSEFEKLDPESASHLFYTASYAATAVFEGLKAHGSNIILKEGVSDDNPNGGFCLHVLPRWDGDGLDLIHPPSNNKGNLDKVAGKIKDKMFYIEHEMKEKKKEKKKIPQINLDEEKKKMYSSVKPQKPEVKQFDNSFDEISNAINNIKKM